MEGSIFYVTNDEKNFIHMPLFSLPYVKNSSQVEHIFLSSVLAPFLFNFVWI